MPLPSLALDIPLDQAGQIGGPTPAAAPPLPFLQRLKLGYREDQAAPDWGFNQTNWKNGAIAEVEAALRKKGIQPVTNLMDSSQIGATIRPGDRYADAENRLYTQLFAQVAQARQTDPTLLPDYMAVSDKGSFDQLIEGRRKSQLQDVAGKAPDGLGFAGLLGSFGHRSLDPINYLPIGGGAAEAAGTGARILRNGLRWGLFNAGMAAATEPMVRQDARALGIDRTFGDFVTGLLGAGAGGFVLGAAGATIKLAPSAVRARSFAGAARRFDADQFGKAFNRVVKNADLTPGSPFSSFDPNVARIFAEIVPEEQRTPDEQAAIHAVQRAAEVKATSPFVPGPAGDDAHAAALDRGMAALHGEPAAPGTVTPIARERIASPADVDGARFPARELVKAKIHQVEAPNGGPNLAGGAALGPYQFEPRTWVNLFKRRYPKDGRSFDQIAALREDPHLNDVLMNDLMAENAAALRHAGLEETSGNLYLAHVLGHDRAVTVLRADPDARLGDLLPEGYFKGNPFKRTDTSASLVHWAYGKMGDDGRLPVHIDTPEIAQGAEAIRAADIEPSTTGRFDVEALYGDVGMADRPVLNPDLFDSPELHSAAQVRFERESDMADGFAPVMSRAEAFAPSEHFAAVRSYHGKQTTDAMAEALGLSPGELRHVVGAMQAVDPNSPFMLTRGRPPKFDKLGNVTREGTEAGRVIRRPRLPVSDKPATMLEFLTAKGGLLDINPTTGKGGDLKSMGGEHWHKAAPFRRKLIDNENGQPLDDAFQRAIEAGYFPEHGADAYHKQPDLQDFRDAIDAELRGKPRFAIDEMLDAHDAARRAMSDPEEADRAERLLERAGHNQGAISEAAAHHDIILTDDEMVIDASDLIDAGYSPDEALYHAAIASAYRRLDEAAAETGNSSYAINPDERFSDDGLPEERGGDDGDFPPGAGGGRSEGEPGAAAQARSRLEELAHDPAAGLFSDPIGDAAEAQADSVIHDLEMAVHGSTIRALLDRKQRLNLRQRWFGEQERTLGREAAMDKLRASELDDKEPWLDPDYLLKTYEADPDAGAAILEAIAEHGELRKVSYRIDEEGGESDLAGILGEIEEAQKAAAEMRNCLKPKGGNE